MFSLKEDMTEYYRLIAVLQAQLNLDGERAEAAAIRRGGTEGLTLRRLAMWVVDPLERLKVMATLTAAAANLQVSQRVETGIGAQYSEKKGVIESSACCGCALDMYIY